MRDDFCTLILTHRRPDRVYTYSTLERSGYTGKLYIVVDDEDPTRDQYRQLYGDKVLEFSKADMHGTFDIGDNDPGHRGVVYARNAAFDLAKRVGCRYFLVLDDDYTSFFLRFTDENVYSSTRVRKIDSMFESLIEFMEDVPRCTCIAMSQGGDHIGGGAGKYGKQITLYRKVMNSFLCDTERRFEFLGRINEDTNTYVIHSTRGAVFFTFNPYQITQLPTQHNPGGLTDLYLDVGTYVKSMQTVVYAPSCVFVHDMGEINYRLHHLVKWNNTAPKILRETLKKERPR